MSADRAGAFGFGGWNGALHHKAREVKRLPPRSRNGEPFKALIKHKKFLPNAVTRFCTSHLKVETMKMFMVTQGYDRWLNLIGLRHDEGHRVLKQIVRNHAGLER